MSHIVTHFYSSSFFCGERCEAGLWHLKTRLLILGGVHCSFYYHPFLSSNQTPFALAKGVKASNLVLRCQRLVLRAANYCRTSDNVRLNLANFRAKIILIGHWSDHKQKIVTKYIFLL